jgi:cytoskeletal protein CcmA (bactofilin family)
VLRMGRKPDQVENEVPVQNAAPYNVPTTFQQPVSAPAEQSPLAAAAANGSRQMRAFTDTENLARDLKDGTVSGFVGTGTTVQGEATFRGMMRIDGHLIGSVKSEDGTLIISSGGKVDATIAVAVANINGTVRGDIVATERIELGRSAQVTGNISAPSLIIEQGAMFDGNCRMTIAQNATNAKAADLALQKKKAEAVPVAKQETAKQETAKSETAEPAPKVAAEVVQDRNGSAVSRPTR